MDTVLSNEDCEAVDGANLFTPRERVRVIGTTVGRRQRRTNMRECSDQPDQVEIGLKTSIS